MLKNIRTKIHNQELEKNIKIYYLLFFMPAYIS